MILGTAVSRAQDIHFSQFSVPSSFLNPALTGDFHGDWRAGLIHRDQWRSIAQPYVSSLAFFDRQFYLYSQQINAGIILIRDQSGLASLTNNKVYLNLSYHVKSGRSTIMLGLQPGLVIKSFNPSKLTFPSQWDQSVGYFNGELDNMENGYGNRSIYYFDLGAGMNWAMDLPGFRPSVGFAFFHLNQANESFNGASSKLVMRQVIHANARIAVRGKHYLFPELSMNTMNRANSFIGGLTFGKRYGASSQVSELFCGISARTGFERNADAAIPMIGMKIGHWRTALSYDINISNLSQATQNRGAAEISIVYTALSTIPKHSAIPCERF